MAVVDGAEPAPPAGTDGPDQRPDGRARRHPIVDLTGSEPALALPHPDDRQASIDAVLETLAADGRLVHVERQPARPARRAELARPLPAAIAHCLPPGGLWSHQARAIDLVRDGRSVVVATGTASGKSLCYQIPIAESVVTGLRAGTSLLLFPTKALAQDQLRALGQLGVPGLVATAYDGDASQQERAWARANANVVLTNPEMLHHGLLPYHAKWGTFLKRLDVVVVDELHVLRGVFGTHVGHLLRRLRRICARYGSDPTFVFESDCSNLSEIQINPVDQPGYGTVTFPANTTVPACGT